MTDFIYRVTAICPASMRPALGAISEVLGYGAGTLSSPLSADGSEPATHYASSTVARQGFVDMLTDTDTQEHVLTTTDWTPTGMTEEQVRLVLRGQKNADPAIMVIGPASDNATAQLQTLLDAHGLQRVVVDL